jgi:hypothetical protein
MRYVSPALVIMAALMLQTPVAHAVPMTFAANLTGAAEIPPVASPGFGQATVVLDPTANTLHVDITFGGLTSGTAHSLLRGFRRARQLYRCHHNPEISQFPGGSDFRNL